MIQVGAFDRFDAFVLYSENALQPLTINFDFLSPGIIGMAARGANIENK